MQFIINPKRLLFRNLSQRLRYYARLPLIRFGLWLGFFNMDYGYVSGYPQRVKIGKGCSTMNTLFNTQSGTITIGDHTIFGDNCMLITGYHRYYKGRRARLHADAPKEVPDEGHDITIGSGCYIGSGAIILRNVTIGDNVMIGAGSVVTKNIPGNCFACGIPAQVKHFHHERQDEVNPNWPSKG